MFPLAPDPGTGGRQLEHLAFEVVSTEALSHAAKKAADLSGRGVRRVFAIDVERARAFEWSPDLGTWRLLESSGSIVDCCLAVPLPIDALINASKADDVVARALLAKRNPVLVRALAEVEAKEQAVGRLLSILEVLAQRDVAVGTEERGRILAERDVETLKRWLQRAMTCASVTELFVD